MPKYYKAANSQLNNTIAALILNSTTDSNATLIIHWPAICQVPQTLCPYLYVNTLLVARQINFATFAWLVLL